MYFLETIHMTVTFEVYSIEVFITAPHLTQNAAKSGLFPICLQREANNEDYMSYYQGSRHIYSKVGGSSGEHIT